MYKNLDLCWSTDLVNGIGERCGTTEDGDSRQEKICFTLDVK